MPIQIILYQCNECTKIYSNEKTAYECEHSHFKADHFDIKTICNTATSLNVNFPIHIEVINLKNKMEAEYRFVRSIKLPMNNPSKFQNEEEDG